MYDYILFDLDGTLTDPKIGITNSVMYSLEKFGIEVKERASLYKFIGPPLMDSFQKYFEFSHPITTFQMYYFTIIHQKKDFFKNNEKNLDSVLQNSIYEVEVDLKIRRMGHEFIT